MLTDAILLVLQGVANIILAPLSVVNVGVDLVSSIPYVSQFLQVVAYVLPWDNLLPLVLLMIALFLFRITVAIINFILKFVPFFG